MNRPARPLAARSVVAAAGLVVVLVGIPCLLYGLGGGLPTSLPSGHQLHHFVTQPITDSAVLRGVSLVCWALWALFALAVISEAVAYVHRRPSPSQADGGFRVPGIQAAAGALFLTAMLLLPPRAATAAASTLPRVPLAYPTQLVATGPAPTPTAWPAPVAQPTVAADLTGRGWHPYTVVRYDTPWGIAESHLGNGLRWREILDTDGHTLATGTDAWVERAGHWEDDPQARLIFPGQELLLPPDAVGFPPTSSDSSPQTAPNPHPQPAPTPIVAPASTSATRPVGGEPSPNPASRSDPQPSTPADPPSRAPTSHEVLRAKTSSQDDAEVIEVSSAILAAGIVAAAALNTLGRLRVGQSRRSRPGRRIRLPGPELAETELALRIASRDDLLGLAHRAVHALAADLATVGLPTPEVCGLLVSDESVEVLLGRPLPPPPSWQTSGEGFRWTKPASALPPGAGDGLEPFPTLVPLGRVPGASAEALVNLESAGLVEVVGSEPAAAGIVHAAAVALAGLPWASAGEVVLVGFGEALAATAAHLRFVPTFAEVRDELNDLVADRNPTAPSAVPLDDSLSRCHREPPTVVLCARTLDGEHLEWLRSTCSPGNGIAALVVADNAHGSWAIDADADPTFVAALRVALEPISLPETDFDALSDLATVALDTAGVAADQPPYDQLERSAQLECSAEPDASTQLHHPALLRSTRAAHTAAEEVPDIDTPVPAVTVKVLGPVEFDGAGEFRRPRSPEIALYLAMHPRGVTEAQLDERIWPGRTRVPAATRDTAISAVRSALGGAGRFPHAHQGPDKRYQLSDQVGTDWQRFCALHRRGRDHQQLSSLRAALELIRGRPFGDLDAGPGYEWLHLEGHLHHMEAEIADAADLAARLYLDQQQPLDARWAARQGLLAAPYTERLWVALMAAADALGEAQEVERILADMDRRLGLDGDYDQLHPDTIAAYRQHSRRGRRAVT